MFGIIHNLPYWQLGPISLKMTKKYLWPDGGVVVCSMLT
jgi:hypothetical protein